MGKLYKAIEHMHEELNGAHEYAEMANLLKHENRSFADKLIRASEEELRHAVMFHDYVVSLIDECKRKNPEHAALYAELMEHEHLKEIRMMEKIRMLHAEYNK